MNGLQIAAYGFVVLKFSFLRLIRGNYNYIRTGCIGHQTSRNASNLSQKFVCLRHKD
jgi:hypothetical protein